MCEFQGRVLWLKMSADYFTDLQLHRCLAMTTLSAENTRNATMFFFETAFNTTLSVKFQVLDSKAGNVMLVEEFIKARACPIPTALAV